MVWPRPFSRAECSPVCRCGTLPPRPLPGPPGAPPASRAPVATQRATLTDRPRNSPTWRPRPAGRRRSTVFLKPACARPVDEVSGHFFGPFDRSRVTGGHNPSAEGPTPMVARPNTPNRPNTALPPGGTRWPLGNARKRIWPLGKPDARIAPSDPVRAKPSGVFVRLSRPPPWALPQPRRTRAVRSSLPIRLPRYPPPFLTTEQTSRAPGTTPGVRPDPS